jgi:REP element-mobilizing transposase RayT
MWYMRIVAKPRKNHEQLELRVVGRRRRRRVRRGVRLGRPPKGPRSSERHGVRPEHDPRNPVLVTCRIARDLRTLRTGRMYRAIRCATRIAARRADFRIVHLSIQKDHLHLIVEADSKLGLARGMQGFAISAAKQIHRVLRETVGARRGTPVFTDRYHPRALKTPTEVRHALAYVLNNWRKHGEHHTRELAAWPIDLYASGIAFDGWNRALVERPPPTYEPLVVVRAHSWLLARGWRRAGGPISMRAVPGPLRSTRSQHID